MADSAFPPPSKQRLLDDEDWRVYDAMAEQRLAPYRHQPVQVPEMQSSAAVLTDEMAKRQAAREAFKFDPPPGTPDSDYDAGSEYRAGLQKAQADSREKALLAGLFKANDNVIQGATGVKSTTGDGLQALADKPVEDFNAQFNLDKALTGMRTAAAQRDPASQSNRTAQKIFAASYPEIAAAMGPDVLALQTEASLQNYAKNGTKIILANNDMPKAMAKAVTEDNKTQIGATQTQINSNKADFAEGQGTFTAATQRGAASKINVGQVGPDGQPVPNAVDERFDITRTDKLSKTTSDFSPYMSALQKIETVAPGYIFGKAPKKPAGLGDRLLMKDPTGLGARFVDPLSQQQIEAVNELADLIGRDRSGAVLNEGEQRRYQAMLQNGVAGGAEQTAIALNTVRQMIGAKLKAAQAAAMEGRTDRKPLERHRQGGGLTYDHPYFTDVNGPGPEATPEDAPAPAPGQPDRIVDLDAQEAPPIPTKAPVREPGGAAAPVPKPAPKTSNSEKITVTNLETGEKRRFPKHMLPAFQDPKKFRVE